MREEFSKVCFETLLQFSFSNKVSTPQEGYISRMALSVLLKRSQDVLRRYVEDERLSGRCPLPRYRTDGGLRVPAGGATASCGSLKLQFLFVAQSHVTRLDFHFPL